MPDIAAFCPGCGRSMRDATRATGMVGVLPQTLAGALAYFVLPAILFLSIEPYKHNRFVRFHSFQCFGVCLGAVVVTIGGVVLFFTPVLGHLLIWLVALLAVVAFFIIWIVLMIKALQGEMFKLPLVGDFAEKQANAEAALLP